MGSKNTSTENTVLKIGKGFDPTSGVALVCAYENQRLFAHSNMAGKHVLEVGCGTLPAQCCQVAATSIMSVYG